MTLPGVSPLRGVGLLRCASSHCQRPSVSPDSLTRWLAAHRTVALQVMRSRNRAVALAAVGHVFEQRVFGDEYWRAVSAVQIAPQLSAHALQPVVDDLKQSTAWQLLEAARPEI